MTRISWGAVLFGATTGLGGALLAFLILGIAGMQNDLTGRSILLFLVYAAFLLAGFVAGRAASDRSPFHGGLAAMTLFAVQVVLSGANTFAIVVGGTIAAIIGSAGGTLGQWVREESGGGSQDDG